MLFANCLDFNHKITKPFSALIFMSYLQTLKVSQLCDTQHQSLTQ